MLHRRAQDICSLLHSILQLSHGNPPQNGLTVLWEGLEGFLPPPFFFFFPSSLCLNGGGMSRLTCFAWRLQEPKDTAISRDRDSVLPGPSHRRLPSPCACDYGAAFSVRSERLLRNWAGKPAEAVALAPELPCNRTTSSKYFVF